MNIPEGTKTISGHMFRGCTSLTRIDLPSTITSIGDLAFYDCDALSYIVLPEGVTSIGASAFYSCAIEELDIPSSVTSIGAEAFRFTNLTSAVIPEGVTEIPDGLFNCANHLSSVTLHDGITSIGDDAFAGCPLTSIALPENLLSIGQHAFDNCTALEEITIPAGVTSLPSGTALSCGNMTSAIIPTSVTEIASDAFDSTLSTVFCYRGSYADAWAQRTGRNAIYLDDADIEDYISLTGETAITLDHGASFSWRDLVSLDPLPQGSSYTLRCATSDASVAGVSGDIVSVLSAGTAKLTVTVDELPWLSHMITLNAYNPVESFTLPTAVFMPAGGSYEDRITLRPQNVSPSDTNPMYSWTENGSSWSDEYEERTYWPQSSAYVTTVTASAQSGVSRTCKVVTYQTIGTLRFKAFPAHVDVGMTIAPGVILFLDGVAYVDEPALYTLSSSNTAVVKPTVDGRLKVVGRARQPLPSPPSAARPQARRSLSRI